MDKQGNLIKTIPELRSELRTKEIEPAPRKVKIREFPSPNFQRRWKIEKERRERAAFEKQIAFRAAQEQNPIKPKPRGKRGRKFRSR